MKRQTVCFLAVMAMVFCAVSFAQATTITRDVTVAGDSTRGPLVTGLVNAYFPDTKAIATEDKNLGEYVIVTGPSGTEKIHFSPKLVATLQKLAANPRASESLMSVCPGQAGSLQKAIGPMRATHEPLVRMEKISKCDEKGGCFGPGPVGKYMTLQPYQGVRLVSNSNNPRYPANAVTFKIERNRANLPGWPYGNNWGPTIVLRNITMENPIHLVDANAGLILSYLQRITALKQGQPGNEGDSCWEVVILRNGTIYADNSPAEARFVK